MWLLTIAIALAPGIEPGETATPKKLVKQALICTGRHSRALPLRRQACQVPAHGLRRSRRPRPVSAQLAQAASTPELYDIPLSTDPTVDKYIQYFSGSGRKFFGLWLERLDRLKPLMEPILEKAGIPKDHVYLALIESGLSAKAVSTASAVGYWQFVSATARLYGLRMDSFVDERRDLFRSTEAASRLLVDLERGFGDWHLAWAAYNAGAGRISRALAQYGVRDYWSLVRHHRSVAQETQHYVPKMIAAAVIGKNRERYGFAVENPQTPVETVEVSVDGSVQLRVLAAEVGIEHELLTFLNSALVYGITPPRESYRLRVPKERADSVRVWLAEKPQAERLDFAHYRVRKGDTLSGVAQKFGSTVSLLAQFNDVRNVRLLRPGVALLIPKLGPPVPITAAKPAVARAKPVTQARSRSAHKTYVVAQGDTLWSIAQRHGISVDKLQAWNQRRGNHLGVGDVLKLF